MEGNTHVNRYLVIADDDMEDHLQLRKAAKECGLNHIVTSVYNGQQLMDLLEGRDFYRTENKRLPDVLLLDLHMPVMSGLAALRSIRTSHRLRNLDVRCFVSRFCTDAEKEEARQLGVSEFIPKPFKYSTLVSIVKTLCDGM